MSEQKNSLIERIKNNSTLQKIKSIKNIEIIIAVIVCVVAIGIYLISGVGKGVGKSTANESEQCSELEQIISNIKGVGKTKVYITYQGEIENREDNDSYFGSSSKEDKEIIGVIVVSEGAGNPEAEIKILKAVQTATGVALDKIKIFEMGEGS